MVGARDRIGRRVEVVMNRRFEDERFEVQRAPKRMPLVPIWPEPSTFASGASPSVAPTGEGP